MPYEAKDFKPGQYVRVLRGKGYRPFIESDEIRQIAFIVLDGRKPNWDSDGDGDPDSGILLTKQRGSHPYVWSFDRFEPLTQQQYETAMLQEQLAEAQEKLRRASLTQEQRDKKDAPEFGEYEDEED